MPKSVPEGEERTFKTVVVFTLSPVWNLALEEEELELEDWEEEEEDRLLEDLEEDDNEELEEWEEEELEPEEVELVTMI